jgi:hypothetical protein
VNLEEVVGDLVEGAVPVEDQVQEDHHHLVDLVGSVVAQNRALQVPLRLDLRQATHVLLTRQTLHMVAQTLRMVAQILHMVAASTIHLIQNHLHLMDGMSEDNPVIQNHRPQFPTLASDLVRQRAQDQSVGMSEDNPVTQ